MDKWKELKLYRNTSKTYEIQFTKNGFAQNITGWTIYFTVKENMEDSDTNAKIKKDITNISDPINGIALIELSTTDTDLKPKSYFYDVKYKDNNGNADILITGRITVQEPVTTRG